MPETPLEESRRHAREGRERLDQQERLIEHLAEIGATHMVSLADRALRSMREFQQLAEDHLEQILHEQD